MLDALGSTKGWHRRRHYQKSSDLVFFPEIDETMKVIPQIGNENLKRIE
ncbi:hypothetical protein J155_03048 [Xanthomonas citri pv. citri]|nr:hypothetical protein J151_03059 [Xanthomonas citri subsp. citri A306]AJY82991.1 hypothetical protein J159_03042 [Xanthomonas citri pv. citri]AJY87417.1 hypothetical protein J158_03046 [Xanthomonas citri subsp. citri UI6]AJY91852.1 hypothetical protein J169_03057 [Xanthomonas citri pv. citri]AJY96308.1 hypothetical protein J164_03042 [Xanthomonas citri pv. citri]